MPTKTIIMKKKILIQLSAIVLIVILDFTGISPIMAQTWESVDGGGAAGINSTLSSSSVNPSVAVFNGELYAIWKESISGVSQVHIKKYNGSSWIPAGNVAGQSQLNTSSSNAVDPKIITYNGALYAAWEEYESGITNIHVKKYDGSSWSFVQNYTVGDGRININRGSTSTNATKVDLIVFNNELYAAWIEQDGGGTNYQQVRAAKFNGSLWTNIDGGGNYGLNYNILASTYFVSLAVYNNKLYVTWTENSSSYAILHIKRYDGGSTWTFIDGNSADGLNYDPIKSVNNAPSLSSYNGKLYTFWSENSKIRVKQYDESSRWTSGPDEGINGWNYSAINGAYNPSCYVYGNYQYVSWENVATTTPVTRQIRVVSFDGVTKNFIDGNAMSGINQNTTMIAHNPKLIDYKGDLYAVWNEDNGGSDATQQIRAKKYSLPPFVESVLRMQQDSQ